MIQVTHKKVPLRRRTAAETKKHEAKRRFVEDIEKVWYETEETPGIQKTDETSEIAKEDVKQHKSIICSIYRTKADVKFSVWLSKKLSYLNIKSCLYKPRTAADHPPFVLIISVSSLADRYVRDLLRNIILAKNGTSIYLPILYDAKEIFTKMTGVSLQVAQEKNPSLLIDFNMDIDNGVNKLAEFISERFLFFEAAAAVHRCVLDPLRSRKWKPIDNPWVESYPEITKEIFSIAIIPQQSSSTELKDYIVSPKQCPLYISDRLPIGSLPSRSYELKLRRQFWDELSPRLVFIKGDKGCGKSTFINYYLRSFCPNDLATKEKFLQKLLIFVDCSLFNKIRFFEEKFYSKARDSIVYACALRNIPVNKELFAHSGLDQNCLDKSWVLSALRYLSNRPFDGPNGKKGPELQYIVLLLDNIDQADMKVQQAAIDVVRDWLSPRSGVNLWRVLIPIWPSTLSNLNFILDGHSPDYECFELPPVAAQALFERRIRYARYRIHRDDILRGRLRRNTIDYLYLITSLNYFKETPSFFPFLEKLTNGNIRTQLQLLHGMLSGMNMYEFYTSRKMHLSGRTYISKYCCDDALICANFSSHSRYHSRILNIYNVVDVNQSFTDLLIGPHILFLLKHGVNIKNDLLTSLKKLGYDRDLVVKALEFLEKFGVFSWVSSRSSGEYSGLEPSRGVIDSYEKFIAEPVYLDNMAVVSSVTSERAKEMAQTVSYNKGQITIRVRTAIKFIEQIRSDEREFCMVERFSSKKRKAFTDDLSELRLPCLWKMAAINYKERMLFLYEGYQNMDYLVDAPGVNHGWLESVLTEPIFNDAQHVSDFLEPIK